jgi:hypothetical protein
MMKFFRPQERAHARCAQQNPRADSTRCPPIFPQRLRWNIFRRTHAMEVRLQ